MSMTSQINDSLQASIHMSSSELKPTFLVNIFRDENPMVAIRALTRPAISNDTSVSVAILTPRIIGNIDKYTYKTNTNLII